MEEAKLRSFFQSQPDVEDYIFVWIDKIESYAKTQRLHSKKQSKVSDSHLKKGWKIKILKYVWFDEKNVTVFLNKFYV